MIVEPDHLYFVRAADGGGPVKIGRSSAPEKRLGSINTSSPHRLVIAAVARGWGGYERHFHALFAPLRMHREWFSPALEIDAAIVAINEGTFDFGSVAGVDYAKSGRLREWRKREGKTTVWLAEQSGTTNATISRIERGLQSPKADLARRLQAVTGIPAGVLVMGDAA